MKNNIKLILVLLIVVGLPVIFFVWATNNSSLKTSKTPNQPENTTSSQTQIKETFSTPISKPLDRITKKHFSIYITPKSSPVSPEKFTGYHTGVDFETFPEEKDRDIPIYSICSGQIVKAEFGRGYGGMIVQRCILDDQPIVVVYGHVRLTDLIPKVGSSVEKGTFLTNLGTGFSPETDGERKHLHLSIHKGENLNTSGYTATKASLTDWIDFEPYLK